MQQPEIPDVLVVSLVLQSLAELARHDSRHRFVRVQRAQRLLERHLRVKSLDALVESSSRWQTLVSRNIFIGNTNAMEELPVKISVQDLASDFIVDIQNEFAKNSVVSGFHRHACDVERQVLEEVEAFEKELTFLTFGQFVGRVPIQERMFDSTVLENLFDEAVEIILSFIFVEGYPLADFRIIDFLKSPSGLRCHYSSLSLGWREPAGFPRSGAVIQNL